MKKVVIVMVAVLCLLTSACSAISKADYDTLVSENAALKSQLADLSASAQSAEATPVSEPAVSEEATAVPTEEATPTPETSVDIGSRKSPVKLGETLSGSLESGGDPLCNFDMKIVKVIRGAAAWKSIKKANMFNDKPSSKTEYVLVKVYVKNTADLSGDDSALEVNQYDFSLATSDDSISSNQPTIVMPKPQVRFKLFEGSSKEGYIAFLVDKTETNLKAVFVDSFWFSLQ